MDASDEGLRARREAIMEAARLLAFAFAGRHGPWHGGLDGYNTGDEVICVFMESDQSISVTGPFTLVDNYDPRRHDEAQEMGDDVMEHMEAQKPLPVLASFFVPLSVWRELGLEAVASCSR